MGIYKRGDIYWARYAGPGGKIVRESAQTSDKRVAARFESQRRAQVDDGSWQPLGGTKKTTVAQYAEKWIARQHERKLATAGDQENWMRKHVLPLLGSRAIEGLRPRDVIEFVRTISAGELAPRSVHHVYNALRGMMRDAHIDEVIISSPCVLPPKTLPKKKDADPKWRATAIFAREEIEALISDERTPLDRRMFYALLFFGGLRHGEGAGRRWRDYDAAAKPLGRLTVATQYDDEELKTENPRVVPVHPTLAAMLAEWKLSGFGSYFGRSPHRDDWLVPSRRGNNRAVRHTLSKLHEDLERIGLRPRRTHDLRRTFVTLARSDGADRDVLKVVTHGASTDVLDLYTSYPWATLCESVSKLNVQRLGATEVHSLEHTRTTEKQNPLETRGFVGGADGTRSRQTVRKRSE